MGDLGIVLMIRSGQAFVFHLLLPILLLEVVGAVFDQDSKNESDKATGYG